MESSFTPLKAITCVVSSSPYCSPSGSSSPIEKASPTPRDCCSIPLSRHASPISPTVATSPTLSTTSSSSSSSKVPNVSDEELAHLSVRQLNQRLQGQDRQVVSALKQKRRTLKNRGYAFNCRVRRIQNQLQLEADNMMLKDERSSMCRLTEEKTLIFFLCEISVQARRDQHDEDHQNEVNQAASKNFAKSKKLQI
uniref:BZIP_Maf domain-containing protein n=1 Tax=Ascaris lumbricoides TaxID=6252 RepID=A0A0M3HUR0_ASCLU